MDRIKYNTGASNLGGSLNGQPESALSKGFVDTTPTKPDPWAMDGERQDDAGTNSVGDRYAFRSTGACGRPDGNER